MAATNIVYVYEGKRLSPLSTISFEVPTSECPAPKVVKAAGGILGREPRGHAYRQVTLPLTGEGKALADKLLATTHQARRRSPPGETRSCWFDGVEVGANVRAASVDEALAKHKHKLDVEVESGRLLVIEEDRLADLEARKAELLEQLLNAKATAVFVLALTDQSFEAVAKALEPQR